MIIQSKRVWVLNNWIDAQIEVEDGKIANIYPYETKPVDKDYGDKRIVPGFIDVHTHGDMVLIPTMLKKKVCATG